MTRRSDSKNISLNRRDFLKLSALGVGAGLADHAFAPLRLDAASLRRSAQLVPDFPKAERLGRVSKGSALVKTRPDPDSALVETLYEDAVVPWLHELVGEKPNYNFSNQKWVEVPNGFVYAPFLQPVRNLPNEPVEKLPESSHGAGTWMEVTIPYVDVVLDSQPTSNSWVKARSDEGLPVRFYYSQVFWIDRIRREEDGQVFYRVNPNFYGGVDMLWARAEAFRPIQTEDITPIHPEAEEKRVLIDVNHQSLACYEGSSEVYFCRISTGAKFDMYGNAVDKWATPVGTHMVSRKFISLQMSGGSTGAGYDLPGIGWVSIFATGGVSIHSTFWHNNYGDPMSHGCVNARPEDARWIFRWALPDVPFDPGMYDIAVQGGKGTKVEVIEG